MKTTTCSCGSAATVIVELPIRVMAEHRTELRKLSFCKRCAAAFNAA